MDSFQLVFESVNFELFNELPEYSYSPVSPAPLILTLFPSIFHVPLDRVDKYVAELPVSEKDSHFPSDMKEIDLIAPKPGAKS